MDRLVLGILALTLVAAGCGAREPRPAASAPPGTATSTSTTSASPQPPATSASAPEAEPVPHEPSLLTLFEEDLGDPELTVVGVLAETAELTRYEIAYRTQGVLISGTVTKPAGEGPFPAVVSNHGLIDPAVYTVGQGLVREEEALVRAGYVTFHSDYRGYGRSDPVEPVDRELRLGYTRDVIQAVAAVRSLPYVDGRVAMVGRSMGGGLTLNVLVTRPGLVDAAVLLSPVSTHIVDNLEALATLGFRTALYDRFGSPADAPDFYRDLSAATFLDRIKAPVAIQHGDADTVCPLAWSEETLALLTEAGVDASLHVYPGEEHVFEASASQSAAETVAFVQQRVPTEDLR